jgi:type 1 glutamine amidotransferase
MKVTVIYGDGQREEQVYHNAIEFADYGPRVEVPGSRFADVVSARQVRFFSKALKRTAPIDRIVLESFASDAAPTTVAITAELAGPDAPPLPAPAAPPTSSFRPQFSDPVPNPPAEAPGPRVLLVGGGSSHDFPRHFGKTDRATLAPHCGWVAFTQNLNGIGPILDRIDVLVLSANQAVSAETREALLAFAATGKGIVALHPGTWYAWGDFPQWNRHLIGGGTRGHDPLGAFTVAVVKAGHPVMRDVAPSFPITDELYHFTADPVAVPIEVLAEATSPVTGKTFPQVFVAKHPKARIVGITLGHDARSHELPAFRTLLVNAVKWAAATP